MEPINERLKNIRVKQNAAFDKRQLYYGSREVVEFPEIRTHKFHKDFYWGFYCTYFEAQATRWANKYGYGTVNIYSYTESSLLKVLRFQEMTEAWLDFIVACRTGTPHAYDVVEGPMADDTIFNYLQAYLDGEITRKAFWALAEFKYPTHQISFHTARALSALSFERSYTTNEEKK